MKLKFNKVSASEVKGIILVILGVTALAFYYGWWFQEGRLASLWLVIGFIAAIFYGIFQLLASWILFLCTHRRPSVSCPPPEDLTVDVFVTACGESLEMIGQCLEAACNMHLPHQTWLLDDGQDPQLAQLAQRLGAGYLTRKDRKDAKAGNVNTALTCTTGDIIAIFDIDHIPRPDFLQQSLGSFTDPSVGFAQVMPTFSNHARGWVATAATETTFDFYNPTSKGMDSLNSVTKMGTNSLIRRTALESIGGYQPGLAEDLATSIALHAAGWKSRYIAEPLAPGLAPSDLTAWFTQQFKWSRGVFEVLLTTFPRVFCQFNWGQRLSYAVRTTKYLIGPILFAHIVLLINVLLSDNLTARLELQRYFIHLAPLAIMDTVIHGLALRKWRHATTPDQSLWRAVTLIFATWPVYTLAWIMALLRLPVSFRPTPKSTTGKVHPLWLMPQLVNVFLLLAGMLYTIKLSELTMTFGILYLVTAAFALPQLGLLRPLLRPTLSLKKRKTSNFPELNSLTQRLESQDKFRSAKLDFREKV